MSPSRSFPALGFLGGHSAVFPSQLREGTDQHPTLHVTLTVPVSHADIEAVLWWLIEQGSTLAELADVETAVFLVCDALAHEPTHVFTDARDTLAALPAGGVVWERYRQVRAIAEGLIGPRPEPARRAPGRGSRARTGHGRGCTPAPGGRLARGVAR